MSTASRDGDFDFVAQCAGLDKENPNHVRAARHLLDECKLQAPEAIVALGQVFEMSTETAFMQDTSSPTWRPHLPISAETQDLLIDWLGQRPLMAKHRQKESKKRENAQADLARANDICTRIQQIIPFLMRNKNDPERLELLERKYVATVMTPLQNQAFGMAEYLFFLDMFLAAHPETRILGKGVHQAWTYRGRAHEEDHKANDGAKLGRAVWLYRMHRAYVAGDAGKRDKVLLGNKYVRETGSLCASTDGYEWDTEGSADLAELLNQVASHCSACGKADDTLMRCSACQRTFYCTKECQSRHWKSHKRLCKVWR